MSAIIDKLQNENKRLLAEKDRLTKIIKDQLHFGTDGLFKSSNRQKELIIKDLESQVEKLLKKNKKMKIQLEEFQAKSCQTCEVQFLLNENGENGNTSKFHKPVKLGSGLFEKKISMSACPDRFKELERMLDHKSKRIEHLSKEVLRLSKSEKDLTLLVYRLTKSRHPPETLTECLIKEIQPLESQKDNCENYDKRESSDNLCKFKKNSISKSSDKVLKSFTDSYPMQNINDINKLKDIIRLQNLGHINVWQKFIEQLQLTVERLSTFDSLKMPPVCSCEEKVSNTYDYENKLLRFKLDAADRNIKTLENFIAQLKDENIERESELQMVKSKALSGTYSKQGSYCDSSINTMKSYNEELKGRIRCLEEDNLRLKTNMESYETKYISLDATEQEKTLLKSKLDATEKFICSLLNNVQTLQEKLKVVESEKYKLEIEIKLK